MGFLGAAAPWIIRGGGALLGGIFGKKSAEGATQLSPEAQAAMTGTLNLSKLLGQQGSQLVGQGIESTRPASRFFGQLLSGDRSALRQAVAPERAEITDLFRGARRRVEAETRGGVRDLAVAELARGEAGRQSLLLPEARRAAAGSLAQLGLGTAQIGAGVAGAGISGLSSLLGPLIQQKIAAAQIGNKAGGDVGSFIFDMLSGLSFGGGSKGTPGTRQISLRPPG